MKESKHQPDTYETALEKIEQIIENIDPGKTVSITEITEGIKVSGQSNEITKATIMLLKKYGIDYRE